MVDWTLPTRIVCVWAAMGTCLMLPIARAQNAQGGTSTEALQKATQNPVSSLISVPIQNNNNFNIGTFDRSQDVLNIQPVIPAQISANFNLITRIIQPIVWQPYTNQPSGGEYGLGDMNPTFFLSPAKPGRIIWGVGPTFLIPTATNTILGQGKFGMGPSIVLLAQPGKWTLGILANNIWSVAGDSTRTDVNQFLLQYFVNYNLQKGWFLTVQPILTANWESASADRWTVPFGGGVGRIMRLGTQPVNISAQFYGNPVRPPGSSPWGMRLQLAFLFPKGTK